MARLIDADALTFYVRQHWEELYPKDGAMIDAILVAPTVDAVEVIRCENCRWFGEEDDEDGQCWCNLNDISTLRHSFCSHGERRKDGNID